MCFTGVGEESSPDKYCEKYEADVAEKEWTVERAEETLIKVRQQFCMKSL